MPEVSDVFEDAIPVSFDDELAASQTRPRELDLIAGPSGASQPANVFGSGRLTGESAEPVLPRFYDDTIERYPDPDQVRVEDPQTYSRQLMNGVIVSVNTTNYTYSARAYGDPHITVKNQVPQTRPFNPTEINTTMVAVGAPCTLLVTPNGTVYLWEVGETFTTRLICE